MLHSTDTCSMSQREEGGGESRFMGPLWPVMFTGVLVQIDGDQSARAHSGQWEQPAGSTGWKGLTCEFLKI